MRHRSNEAINHSRITKFLQVVQENGVINEWKVVRQTGLTPKQYENMKRLLIEGYDEVLEYNKTTHEYSWIQKGTINKEVVEENE